ncbi:hypothetical protein COV16_00900 [Candidatus Woesearchaeota archaeon CG10_big_fil_rev_8_21_14_0_10_34_8]|nr:MAG: hypothetical protein COV16_00900 [Candidatus Woesearchaeota archaeon CG10_big_fil_rev_8_21_14_0_10_34_8]
MRQLADALKRAGYEGKNRSPSMDGVFGSSGWRLRMNKHFLGEFPDAEPIGHKGASLAERRPIYRVAASNGANVVVKYVPNNVNGRREAIFTRRYAGSVAPEVYSLNQIPGDGIEIIMEAASGSIQTPFDDQGSQLWAACEVALMLDEMHSNGDGHYDVKPDNVVCFDYGDSEGLGLIDFGFAATHKEVHKYVAKYKHNYHGTHGYKAPEFLLPELFDNPVAPDVYSYGMLVRALHEPTSKELRSINSGEKLRVFGEDRLRKSILSVQGPVHPALQEVIAICTEYNPRMRPDFGEVSGFLAQYV